MELVRYVISNILRRPFRALFVVLAGFLSATVLVFSFALGARVTEHIRADLIAKWTGHLWLTTRNDFEFKEENLPAYVRQAHATREYLSASSNVRVVVPWVETMCEIQAGTARQHIMITATDMEKDDLYRQQTEMVSGKFPGPEDEYGTLITTVLARKYKLKIGDSITVFINSAFGARNAMDFVIQGIYQSSAPWWDDGITIRVQDYITMTELGDAFPFFKVYVKDEAGIPAMVRELSARANDFEVKGYRDDQFVRFLLGLGTTNILMFGFMAMIIFLALLIGIRSVILTNIFDRREEIGTLRALGFRRRTVRNLFFGESLTSLFLGYALGAGLVALIGWRFSLSAVRPPLMILQYMFGMTRMAITLDAASLLAPLALLLVVLFLTTFRTVSRETEKQAAAQMANR